MTWKPFVETGRLTLRHLTPDDAALMLAIWNDPAFVRHVGDRGIRTMADAHNVMRRGVLRLYEDYGYGPYRVALKGTDQPIGISGLFRRDGLDVPDLGYSTLPEFCGNGYAYEAACAVIDSAASGLGLEQLIAIVSPGNDASIGLIRKLGFDFERMHRMPEDDDDVCIYSKSLKNNG
jgi:RimJ/RimL family protein N-acetyltransferase